MAHIHELIDFVVNIFIVHNDKVLLINHKELGLWLSIGGHIELDEDPEEAMAREVREECGLKNLKLIGKKPGIRTKNSKFLPLPSFLDIHKINNRHRHIAFNYFAKSNTSKVRLNKEEHNGIRWFTKKDLDEKKYKINENTKFMAKKALEAVK